jgi:hypothetical protein
VIKRFRFASRPLTIGASTFSDTWRDVILGSTAAPVDARPSRIVSCEVLGGLGLDSHHDVVGIESFADVAHLERFEAWSSGGEAHDALDAAVGPSGSEIVVADEHVLRGADWLERRWQLGGRRYKHMAVATRAAGLSPAEFLERWASHSGQVRREGDAAATEIPEDVRGLAYIQDRPRPRASGEWAYDAINEVYFDDLDSLQRRAEWFAQMGDRLQPDLVATSAFIGVVEDVLYDRLVGESL